MSFELGLVIVIASGALYFFIGLNVTTTSIVAKDSWHTRDNAGTGPYLLYAVVFPWTCAKEIYDNVFSSSVPYERTPGIDPNNMWPETTYAVCTTFLWPIKFVVNLVGFIFFLITLIICGVTIKIRERNARKVKMQTGDK